MAEAFDRITRTPGVMGGRACIRGMRITVAMIVGEIAGGKSIDQLLVEFPLLEREDIRQALSYVAELAQEREIELLPA